MPLELDRFASVVKVFGVHLNVCSRRNKQTPFSGHGRIRIKLCLDWNNYFWYDMELEKMSNMYISIVFSTLYMYGKHFFLTLSLPMSPFGNHRQSANVAIWPLGHVLCFSDVYKHILRMAAASFTLDEV